MSELWTTALAGAAAGLGVAVPVGAVGVLLIQEGMRERRGAMAAAAAVATVDLAYAALATALGPLVADALSGVEASVRLASALVLATIAGHGLWASRRRPARELEASPGAPAPPTREAHTEPSDPAGPPREVPHAAPTDPAAPPQDAAHPAPTNPAGPTRQAAHAAPTNPAAPPQDAAHPAPTAPAGPTRQTAHAAPTNPAAPPQDAAHPAPTAPAGPTRQTAHAAPTNPATPPQEAPHAAPSAPATPLQEAHAAPTAPARPTRQAVHAATPPEPSGPARTFARFTALTLINPTTALYFAALTTARGSSLRGGAAGAVFVAGVFAASLLWQQFLVAASGFAGARISPAARAWTFRAGYGLVALYAVKVALPLP
ncbi:hypothetical protein [Streptomyces hundungensis]|uniref:hypothetical protein n=1 Tax=Streptomyces hundungensis TaxID=1077946 RepID=UPI0033C97CE9